MRRRARHAKSTLYSLLLLFQFKSFEDRSLIAHCPPPFSIRRRKYFEGLFPELVTESKPAEVPGLPDDVRRTRAKSWIAGVDDSEVDIDRDPEMLEFNGHTAPVKEQLVGHARRLQSVMIDNNRVVADSMQEHRELDLLNVWSPEEEQIFFKRCVGKVAQRRSKGIGQDSVMGLGGYLWVFVFYANGAALIFL